MQTINKKRYQNVIQINSMKWLWLNVGSWQSPVPTPNVIDLVIIPQIRHTARVVQTAL